MSYRPQSNRFRSDQLQLTEAEWQQIVVEWNATKAEYPQNQFIHQMFEAQVEQVPDAVALVFEHEQLTYRELNTKSNQLAYYLQHLGVGPEVMVGLCVERSLDLVVGLLGILKAGGVYVPIDPDYPGDRLAFIVTDTQMSVLLTQQHLVARLPEYQAQFVCLDTDWEMLSQQSEINNPVSGVQGEQLAYVIYTSGSAGQPKGVLIPHRAIAAHCWSIGQVYGLRKDDHILQFSTFTFDASLEQILPTLLVGARLVLRGKDVWSPADLLHKLKEHGLTVINLPPAYLHHVLQEWVQVPERLLDHRLRLVISGGDRLLPKVLQQWRQTPLRAVRLLNAYGPTETTITATLFEITDQFDQEHLGERVPIGRPLPNRTTYILDLAGNPVPIGVAGELHIGGEMLARGYLNQPDLTAERFIADPFSQAPLARLYKTGDLARYLPDGSIEFLGRIDQQVKIRGFRIELGEIEEVLSHYPDVREAVVVPQEDMHGEKYLVAYMVTSKGQEVKNQALYSHLKRKLPDYMIPAAFVQLESLPLLSTGKVNRQALSVLQKATPEPINDYLAPRTPVEGILANIWAQVLHLKQIGVYDNFFELGGHSLLAMQVISRVQEVFHVELPLRSLFQAPTVSEFASIIETNGSNGQSQQFGPIQPVSREGKLPLSFSQQRVWFLLQLEPKNRSYQFQDTLRFKGILDTTVLERSLNEIVRRHEIFRTTFDAKDGQPVQVIHPFQPVYLPRVDIRIFPESVREVEAQRLINEELEKPFDLAQLPLVRWTLLQLDEQDHVLVHVEHHLLHDGWSINVFLSELQALYIAFSAGNPSPLPELPIQFVDFASWQRQLMQGKIAETQLAYWKSKLANCPVLLHLPTDRPRSPVQRFLGASQRVDLPTELCEALRALSRREGVTLFMTMLAAFSTLLYYYTGQDDICIGTSIANRRLREAERLIGMIINTLILRIDVSGIPSFKELLQRVREVTLEAYDHQDFPFDKLVEALQPERDLSYNPLFQVMFGFHDSPLPDLEFPGLTMNLTEALSNGSAKFDLNITVIPRFEQHMGRSSQGGAQGITIIWEYNTDLFDEQTIQRMLMHYQTLLENIVADTERHIVDLPILTKVECQQLLVEWNDTKATYPREQCIHEMFEAQVKRTPDAIAFVYGDQQMTYRELDMRANQLANYLRQLGVGPEGLVGLYVERSLEMVVGLLGILKSGGAYVPLDPTYPSERLVFMLVDSRLAVLVTQQHLTEHFSTQNINIVCLDADSMILMEQNEASLPTEVIQDNLAYVIYTSGSTGLPKGVQITHRSVVNCLTCMSQRIGLTPLDVLLAVTTLSFDIAVLEIFLPLIVGGRVIVASHDIAVNGEALMELLAHSRATVMQATPATWRMLLAAGWQGNQQMKILCGGEALPLQLAKQLLTKPATLWNLYGPTETTIWSTICKIEPGDESITIGRPIANTSIYLLDAHLRLVLVGMIGELYIGGDGLARGYLHRPELTTERFIPHPFSQEPDARLYKTGDLARYLPDGTIEFLGREDEQVKVRGFRIELGEIKTVLNRHPAVQESFTMTREDVLGEKHLVSYIILNKEHTSTPTDLRGYLQSKLPDYMLPSAFVILDTLPLTPNGKVDRHALPSPTKTRSELDRTFVSPRTTLEMQITQIFEKVLGRRPIGITDNFFDLGGHSLLAIHLQAQLKKLVGQTIPLSTFFQGATVERLASILYQKDLSSNYSPLVGIQPRGSRPPFFCVHPAGGDVFCYIPLANCLGPDQPFYAFEDSVLSETWKSETRLEDKAERYLKALYAFQPQGPYFLGGWSLGGNVAFEMACRMQKQGHEIALLALLDTIAPLVSPVGINQAEKEKDNVRIMYRFVERFAARWSNMPEDRQPNLISENKFRQLNTDERWHYILDVAKAMNFVSANDNDGLFQLHAAFDIYYDHLQMNKIYKPQVTYSKQITLFLTEETAKMFSPDLTLGWSAFSSASVEIQRIPGNHTDLVLAPHVRVLAKHLRRHIDETDERT